jgi:epoxyqueuosine reductase
MSSLNLLIRAEALRLGFEACGFAKARRLDEDADRLETWLKEDRHGTMAWMENHFEKRVDPRLLVDGAKTVISVFRSYNQPEFRADDIAHPERPRISLYAQGDDYHDVLKSSLAELFAYIRSVAGHVEGRAFVDSAPVLDKAWAVQAGIGWLGKNANVLNKELGSFFFIGELIIDLELEPDSPTTDHCGSCTRCIDACPTDAIYQPYRVDATRCISYLTIELREAIPEELHASMGNWMYGCDICQDVCPWNRKARPGSDSDLLARMALRERDLDFWSELDLNGYQELFRKSAVKRTKFSGLKRNIEIIETRRKRQET